LSLETRSEIEEIANNAILVDYDVVTREMALDDAKELGAMALFGEKYGDVVRMVDIGGPWSRELCAGTHVSRSSQVGLVSVVSEASVGSSNRRIEALVGHDAFKSFVVERTIVAELSSSLKAPREQVAARVSDLVATLKQAERKVSEFQARVLREQIPALLAKAAPAGPVNAIVSAVDGVGTADDLRGLVTSVRDKVHGDAFVVALGAIVDGKPSVVIVTTESARAAGITAGGLAKTAAGVLGGGGGGRDDMAQSGGSDPSLLEPSLSAITSSIGA
jgi:alanyl-tRNA synthetase